MHIRILCRTCLGTGHRAVVTARLEDDDTITQVLLSHPCTDCDANGHITQNSTNRSEPPETPLPT
ncbi:hypothetical protein ACFVWN_15235 [Nocardiopsis flavescens]|uniref:Uncharacterized protein n=1 Tax=Nocardiopsis flavescens TaxID=758803 RepID=A0A1M6BCD1_9ACTN|nr:hypothetical protein [Nocardiopsis flavescens]SHI46218.1 hypothetical protein SAMN05421803_101291 [Nocardiopsis flavescens]